LVICIASRMSVAGFFEFQYEVDLQGALLSYGSFRYFLNSRLRI
jgi:hypothetical protein